MSDLPIWCLGAGAALATIAMAFLIEWRIDVAVRKRIQEVLAENDDENA